MYLSDLGDLINEIKEKEGTAGCVLEKVNISDDGSSECLTISYWNKDGFKRKVEKVIDISE